MPDEPEKGPLTQAKQVASSTCIACSAVLSPIQKLLLGWASASKESMFLLEAGAHWTLFGRLQVNSTSQL